MLTNRTLSWRVIIGVLLLFITFIALVFATSDAFAQSRGRGRGNGRPPRNQPINRGPRNENGNLNNGNQNNANQNNNEDNNNEIQAETPVPTAVPSSTEVDTAQFLNTRSLDGSGNNLANPDWGVAGEEFVRIAEPVYADNIGEMAVEVDPRFVSNRIYNDNAANLFSENGVTHWGFIWGQFVDHNVGLREASAEERMAFPFNEADPLEEFENDMGALSFLRSAVSSGTGTNSPREQVNTISSYIDGDAVYGNDAARLDWLRAGSLDGNPNNNSAELLMSDDNYLPLATERGNPTDAPTMELPGALRMNPTSAVIAGDARANENLGLTAVHTLFAREHNRIVDLLPANLAENIKFEIARRVVSATTQFITYEEFLPAFGLNLDTYTGYDSTVNASVANEFATVGYRAHSMIHGEFELTADADDYTQAELNAFEDAGIDIDIDINEVEFAIPLNVAFGQPHLLNDLGLDAMLLGLTSEPQYSNDETIDNQLRSVLFQIPAPNAEDPAACLDGEDLPDCFTMVNDLGVLDLLRAYDHGIPNYNDLRAAYGLPRVTSFTQITGESTQAFPNSFLIDNDDPINDPNIMDYTAFFDANGNEVDADDDPVSAERRSTLAARLAAIYGDVDNVDAFTGMISEAHVNGTEFGPLQLAIWEQQFTALRDGDRFFYENDPVLDTIRQAYGIDFRQSLADVIANNTELSPRQVPNNVFVDGG